MTETLTLWYEDFLADETGELKKLYTWITGTEEGFELPKKIDGEVPVKNTPLDLKQVVTNIEDLKDYIKQNTNFQWYE